MTNIIEVKDVNAVFASAYEMGVVEDSVVWLDDVETFSVNNSPEFLGLLQDFNEITFAQRGKLESKNKLYIIGEIKWKN